MNNLYDKLLYNWERGFYSVVYSSVNGYGMVTTKTSTGSLWFSGWHNERKVVETRIGLYPLEIQNEGKGIEIVDTIHPSELMGKGFQVGDKVKCVDGSHLDGRVFVVEKVNALGRYILENVNGEMLDRELKPVLPVEERGVDMVGNKTKDPVSLEDTLVEESINVDFDSGKPEARVGYLNGKYITIDERDIKSRSHICNCGFWDSEKKWGETVYTQQFGDRCVSMSITNNYVVCSTCGQKLRRVAISYLDTYE